MFRYRNNYYYRVRGGPPPAVTPTTVDAARHLRISRTTSIHQQTRVASPIYASSGPRGQTLDISSRRFQKTDAKQNDLKIYTRAMCCAVVQSSAAV